jgi:hypothetical protein
LYDIDKFGHKKAMKKMKPIFQYTKTAMSGNKKHEIIRVAQENLYMLKRLNERTSCYNVDKWNKDYEASQYYKRNHCQYPSIDFYKTQRCGSFANAFSGISKNSTKKEFYKTHYSYKKSFNNTGGLNTTGKRKKRFEDFSYRDLQMVKRSKSDVGDKDEKTYEFKKISEVGDSYQLPKQKNEDEKQNNVYENQKEEEKN